MVNIDSSKIYQKGQEVNKNVFAWEYILYGYHYKDKKKMPKYTHLRVIKRKSKKEIHMIDVALNGSEENKRVLVRGVSSRYKEVNDFLKICERRKNLVSLFKDDSVE